MWSLSHGAVNMPRHEVQNRRLPCFSTHVEDLARGSQKLLTKRRICMSSVTSIESAHVPNVIVLPHDAILVEA